MKKSILFISLLLGVIIVSLGVYVLLVINTLQTTMDFSNQAPISIKEGSTWDDVLSELKQRGVIETTLGAKIYLNYKGFTPKSGEYKISSEIKLSSLFSIINKGNSELVDGKEQKRVLIREGLTLEEISKDLEKNLSFSSDEFSEELKKFDTSEYDFIQSKSLEGYLFPDTYNFFSNVTPNTVIKTMLDNFEKKALPVLKKKDKYTEYQVLTLASIVEKEVQRDSDRKIVAGIFWNRLNIDMALQSDATVNFITKSGRAQSTLKDLEIDSPYNTYKYKGLPPTPIANVGTSSIEATVNPLKTEYFYFLTTLETPYTTYFSKDYEQHLKFKREHLDNK